MLQYRLKYGDELVIYQSLTVAIPHRDFVYVPTFHDDYVIAVWESVVAVAAKGWRAI